MEGRHRYPEDYEIRQRPLHTHTHTYIYSQSSLLCFHLEKHYSHGYCLFDGGSVLIFFSSAFKVLTNSVNYPISMGKLGFPMGFPILIIKLCTV